MHQFKRWVSSLSVRVDRVLAQVENHEALADAALCDVRRAAARAKVQLGRVEGDGERLRRQLEEHAGAETQWRRRAAGCAASDPERALECLRRSKTAARAVPELERRLEHHRGIEKQLRADVARVEEQLARLAEQRNLMRVRESRAEALGGSRAVESASGDVAEIFDRWDTKITELEIGEWSHAPPTDALAEEYDAAEERDELLAELAELARDEVNGGCDATS